MMTDNRIGSIDDHSNVSPLPIRFENALKESNLVSKCLTLQNIIIDLISKNDKDLQHYFVLLVENIFSCDVKNVTLDSSNWKLRSLSKNRKNDEFEYVYNFLSNDGIMFRLINFLMDDYNRFEFPVSNLPFSPKFPSASFNSAIYSNRLSRSTYLDLNAFEFYLFHFASFITKDSSCYMPQLNSSSSNIESINILYYSLLENYLESFIPIQQEKYIDSQFKGCNQNLPKDHQTSLWKSLSLTTTNFLYLSANESNLSINFDNASQNASPLLQSQPKHPSESNSKFFSLNKTQKTLNNLSQNLHSNSRDSIGSAHYKCEITLAIFFETWINHTSNSSQNDIRLSSIVTKSFSITIEHIRVVRILIKHLHYFVNSSLHKFLDSCSENLIQYNSGGLISSNLNDPLDEFRKHLWTARYPIQANLFAFFRMIMDRWPNDASFRVPLETWLSYIQPWRYALQRKLGNDPNVENLSDRPEFRKFLNDNIFFYTVIYRQIIERMSKQLNLCYSNNSLLIYRVAKVFAQMPLKVWIKEAEANTFSNLDFNTSIGSNMNRFSSHHSTHFINRPQIISSAHIGLESSSMADLNQLASLNYVSLFSLSFRNQIIDLLSKISMTYNTLDITINSPNQKKFMQSKSKFFLFDFITNIFSTSNEESDGLSNQKSDIEKIKNYLSASIEYLADFFDLPQQAIDTIFKNARKNAQLRTVPDERNNNENTSIFEIIDGIPKLTNLGRLKILNGSIKLENLPMIIEGNPDEQPIRSYEINFLVNILQFLSMRINQKFQNTFEKFYNNENYVCRLIARNILAEPVSFVNYEKQQNNLQSAIKIEHLPPRMNLRFAASSKFLFNSFILSLICIMFYSMNSILAFLILIIITSMISFIYNLSI